MSYCESLGTYECSPCPKSEKGRVRGIAIVEKGAPLPDPSSQQDWFNVICSGLAIIIGEDTFRGEVAISATKTAGYGKTQEQTVDYAYTMTGYARLNCNNNPFFNALNFRPAVYELWYVTESKVFETGATANFNIMTPVGADLTSVVETMFEITWNSELGNLNCYDRPSAIFEGCKAYAALEQCLTCEQVTVFPCN